jgi:hypothetical protein
MLVSMQSQRSARGAESAVVLAAGALGTVDLLLKCRDAGTLDRLSPALGSYVRTNSEVLCGVTARDGGRDYSQGIAIDFPVLRTATILDGRNHVVSCNPKRHYHAVVTALVGQKAHRAAIARQAR